MKTLKETLKESQVFITDKKGNKFELGVLSIDDFIKITEDWYNKKIQRLIETKDQDNLNLCDGAVAILEELIFDLHR